MEAKDACKFTYKHIGCDHCFANIRGLKIHESKCPCRYHFVVESILDCKGPVPSRSYLIKWKGYSSKYNTWEPRSNINPELIKDFELEHGVYDHSWPHRCAQCDLPCKSARGIKIHMRKVHKEEDPQVFKGRLADKAVTIQKMAAQQSRRPKIYCEGKELDNVYKFKYLGSLFTADGDEDQDIQVRIAMAQKRWSSLRHIFGSPHLPIKIKIRLYSASVCSLLSFGCETWKFTDKTMRRLNGVNSRMLASFTSKIIQQEARPSTTSLTQSCREKLT